MKTLLNIFIFVFTTTIGFTQNNNDEIRFWKLTSVSGEFRLRADYRNQYSLTAGVEDRQTSSLYSAGILLRTSSYIWSKKFLLLDVDGEYNPEISSDHYLVMPDQAEVRTLSRLGASATFLAQKPVTLTLFGHLDEGYSNRENLTNLKNNNKDYGGILTISNRVLPVSIHYKEARSLVEEIPGGRLFDIYTKNLMAIANKSFGKQDKNELNYSRDYYLSKQNDIIPVSVLTENVNLINSVYLDHDQDLHFNSFISGMNQTRSENMKRYQVSETFTGKLPQRVNLYTNYTFYKYVLSETKSNQNNFKVRADHKLFESLNSGVFGEYIDTKHTYYHESIKKAGFDFLYQKKLAEDGLMILSYKYEYQHHKQISDALQLQILDEQLILSDGSIRLLKNAYVNPSTIVITDATGSVLYQQNFDYIIIPRNNFIEIQRMPGGLIANNSLVLVDYFAIQPGSYEYDVNGQNASARLILFRNFLELYYRYMIQSYSNLKQTEYLTLDYIKQNLYGLKVEYRFASAGVEYDDYNSTIIPYEMVHYFVAFQGNLNNKILYSLNGNIRNYYMIADNVRQKYDDVSGNIGYSMSMHSHFNLNTAYRFQKGEGIDLQLLTVRLEYTTSYRQIYITAGLDFYKRIFIGEKLNFRGGSIEISRRF